MTDQLMRLFDDENNQYCEECNRPLPNNYNHSLCPVCEENQLFGMVKEYVRTHNVNEFELSKTLQIPLFKSRNWIKEGRMEYKELQQQIVLVHCEICGQQISFGRICPSCMKRTSKQVSLTHSTDMLEVKNKMRHMPHRN